MSRRKYWDIPEPNLDPPEDSRQVVCACLVCGREIRQMDEAYDFRNIPEIAGCICDRCATRHYQMELEV